MNVSKTRVSQWEPQPRYVLCDTCGMGFVIRDYLTAKREECDDCIRKRYEREERKTRRCTHCEKIGYANCQMDDFDWREEYYRKVIRPLELL